MRKRDWGPREPPNSSTRHRFRAMGQDHRCGSPSATLQPQQREASGDGNRRLRRALTWGTSQNSGPTDLFATSKPSRDEAALARPPCHFEARGPPKHGARSPSAHTRYGLPASLLLAESKLQLPAQLRPEPLIAISNHDADEPRKFSGRSEGASKPRTP